MLVDSHCHLSFKDFPADEIDGVLQRAAEKGVGVVVNVGAGEGFEGNEAAIKLTEKYSSEAMGPAIASPPGSALLRSAQGVRWRGAPSSDVTHCLPCPQIFCTIGIHPHDAKIVDAGMVRQIEEMAKNPKVVAIGEIGLDFHYLHSPQEVQENVFEQFITLAKKINKPIMIHDRSAGDRTHDILRSHHLSAEQIMIHCFTGSMDLAKKYLDLGCFISFTGIITFKKSEELREVVKIVPLDRLLVETDSPYLTPEPFRGKRNEPAYVCDVAKKIAEIKGVSFEEVAQKTTQNAVRFFKFPLR